MRSGEILGRDKPQEERVPRGSAVSSGLGVPRGRVASQRYCRDKPTSRAWLSSNGGYIPPTDEDRRRIIKQMKVRTTLKGDKSWIHHHNSDSEDEKKSSPMSGRAGGGSPASKPPAPENDRSPVSKPQPGYLIRTEAANSVLRRTASRERAYVLSAAKKSNGIEIEEEEGQQRRSPTVSGSCRFPPGDNRYLPPPGVEC
ncbi:hypothetical protein llap_17181 [Limosa lapponica baueri]|uniref:Uncharacterized protein n=1 Tax=Limosa lapponica baueri TaxID=1758121 RepID=A0A2I0TFG6_LIMLA|nr:hypothetical protein llap_17181 [Limosa lapponica baueri]